jgi:hypothetical protein
MCIMVMYTDTHMCTYVYTYISILIPTQIYIPIQTYICLYVYVYMYIYACRPSDYKKRVREEAAKNLPSV